MQEMRSFEDLVIKDVAIFQIPLSNTTVPIMT